MAIAVIDVKLRAILKCHYNWKSGAWREGLRETENNAYAKFWGDKQRALWYVMVFLEWSICLIFHN